MQVTAPEGRKMDNITQNAPDTQGQVTDGTTNPEAGSQQQQPDPTTQDPPQNQAGDMSAQGGADPQTQGGQDPTNVAFARYRVENTQYKDFTGKIAEQLGMPGASLEELNAKLDKASAQQFAKDSGISEDLAMRIANMERVINATTEEQALNQAQSTLKNVQQEFGETDEGMTNFLNRLGENKIDPYSVDLRKEYIIMNLDKVVSRGVEAQLEKIKASDQAPSGSPGASRPQGGGGDGKINSVAELTAIFDKMEV